MKHGMYGLTIALMVMLAVSRPLSGFAQQGQPLDKTVTVKADHERLEDVLNELAKKGLFTFSYRSDVLDKDKLVTITLKESTIREALELILGKAYDYIVSDDYVIIRPDGQVAAKMAMAGYAMKKAKIADAMQAKVMAKRAYMKQGIGYATDSAHMEQLRQTVRNIVNEMISDGIIKDKDSFDWFGLDNGQFVVDGKNLPDSLRARYAAKYIKADGNGYYCGHVSVTGHGYFFSKEEIVGKGKE